MSDNQNQIYHPVCNNDERLLSAMRRMNGVLKISAHPTRTEWVAEKGHDTYSSPDLKHLIYSVLCGEGLIQQPMVKKI